MLFMGCAAFALGLALYRRALNHFMAFPVRAPRVRIDAAHTDVRTRLGCTTSCPTGDPR